LKATVSREAPRIIAVVNQKGGVGKTTTTVNLGAALALEGFRVLVVDADPQGNATTGFGVEKDAALLSTFSVLLDGASIAEAAVPTGVAGLAIVPSSLNLAGAEIELVDAAGRETRLKGALGAAAADYDLVLIDCPPSLGLLTVNALTAATDVLIPVQAEYYALEGLVSLTTIVRRIQDHLNPTLTILGVLITMYDGRTNLAADVFAEVHRYFPGRVFATTIPRNVRLSEAPSHGKPAVILDARSRGAQAYLALAREIAATGVRS
jgi:chromosome partitioning protein